eukprot:9016632-Ditylum_brightwellii.AAC.1
MATAAPKPYVITHSNALDPYDTASFDMAMKEGWMETTNLSNLAGIDLWDADLKEYKSLPVDIHS